MTSHQLARGLDVSTNGFKVQIEAIERGSVMVEAVPLK
jgi:hypothetical protein